MTEGITAIQSHAGVWGAHRCIDFAQIRLPRKHPAIFAKSATVSGCDLQLRHFRHGVPRQQLIDAVDRVLGDALEHVLQVGLWIQAAEFRGSDQGIHCCGPFASGVRTSEQII